MTDAPRPIVPQSKERCQEPFVLSTCQAVEGRRFLTPFLLIGLCAGILILAAVALPCPPELKALSAKGVALRRVLSLLVVETVSLALAVPLLAVLPHGHGNRLHEILCLVLAVAAIPAASFVVAALASGGRVSLGALALAQVFLCSFAFVLFALARLLRQLGRRAATAQLGASLIALAMVGNVFFANAIIEAARTQGPKMLAIDATLWSNPWLIVGGSILEADPLRSTELYEFSVIGGHGYGFQYPGAAMGTLLGRGLFVASAYAAFGLLLGGIGWLVGRRKGVRNHLCSAPGRPWTAKGS
jgi:hypothetical protein